ncbi:2162_t:CDS:1, partial [Acaulospora morrowiae]
MLTSSNITQLPTSTQKFGNTISPSSSLSPTAPSDIQNPMVLSVIIGAVIASVLVFCVLLASIIVYFD